MHLEKNQLEFLKSLPETGNIPGENIPASQLSIVAFLEKQELIKVEREILHSWIDQETHTYKNTYGWINSISLSEKGKAYLDEVRHQEESSKREKQQKTEFMQSIEKIAKSAEIQSDIALKTSRKADVKGWIAVIISIFALFVEFMAYHKEIFSFLSSIFN